MKEKDTESPLEHWLGNAIQVNKSSDAEVNGRLLGVKDDYLVIEQKNGEHIYYKTEQIRSITMNVQDVDGHSQVHEEKENPYCNEAKFKELINRLKHRYVRIHCGENDVCGMMAGSRQGDVLLVQGHEVIILFAHGIYHISCVKERVTEKKTETPQSSDPIETQKKKEENAVENRWEYAQSQEGEEMGTYVQAEGDFTEAWIVAQDEEADLAFEMDDEDEMEMGSEMEKIHVALEQEEVEVESAIMHFSKAKEETRHTPQSEPAPPPAPAMYSEPAPAVYPEPAPAMHPEPPQAVHSEPAPVAQKETGSDETTSYIHSHPEGQTSSAPPFFLHDLSHDTRVKKRTRPIRTNIKQSQQKTKNTKKKASGGVSGGHKTKKSKTSGKVKPTPSKAWLSQKISKR
ncbi:hypothetical protein [Aneurinibacillus aneurinilyticus]|jgi:hypothetical protein|uniref:hypothetical protein n=1 Tax=Aneurinibacillus aneurinilyticus TaxID=1391 RepID=UPI0023FA25F7|nr:hypothetical protein [Aneurinibacillus aneurinilyticus]MCI1693481.1 hypothetical protein [Aneurinibacillus aneurinilyticus]